MKRVNIGILGYGTVGQGVVEVLKANAKEIERRCGYEISVKTVVKRDWSGIDTSALPFECITDAMQLVTDPEIAIVMELMGGEEPAKTLIETALKHDKHVITANKALIAKHGQALFKLARDRGLELSFEASVAGGVPVIKVLRESMSGNAIQSVAGIINGTGNFILTAMTEQGRAFADVLAEAQALGYAEADPAFDINGTDAAHKITILASLAFGIPLQFDRVYMEGIDTITPADIENAAELGFVIKHLGLAIRRENGVEIRVHPTLIPSDNMLASVKGVMNAVQVQGNAVGNSLYYGPGAGRLPTASAVVADLIDAVRELNLDSESRLAEFGFAKVLDTQALPVLSPKNFRSAYYLRIAVEDEVGVLAEMTKILAENAISIESIVQKTEAKVNNVVPLIVLTDEVNESRLDNALSAIEAMKAVREPVRRIRVEYFDY
ncbi:homoserine dehydrogenase [Suttonella ornithocola]|uniref:Homoserine dehydrogenase n=1 Tax=Suttonella ornithocola TaxID=279832 RepID=A0A380MXB1_9GAMM|nr:homoserine dehydrogenase [Suttonella ornithocola]SUO97199.1 Homoserine dehydrogenase [Suttonella ornithocola]